MIYKLLSRLGIEVWKDVPEYKGHYQVSNLGNFRSLNYQNLGKKKILKKTPKGHKTLKQKIRFNVSLSKNKKQKKMAVSQVVAMAFLKHKPNGFKLVVDHIDNNPSNDRLYNLQVITNRQNCSKDRVGKSKYVGVHWNKKDKRWVSQITYGNKTKYLGGFKTEIEAAQAYQKELQKL